MSLFWELLQKKIASVFIEPSNRNQGTSFVITVVIIVATGAYLIFKSRKFVMASLPSIGDITSYNASNAIRRWMPRGGQMDAEVLKRGGYIAGLVNDGNTCFMNSVIQSLASSEELVKFLDNVIAKKQRIDAGGESEEEEKAVLEENNLQGRKSKGKIYGRAKKHANRKLANGKHEEETEPDVTFSLALRDMLDKLNFKYYKDRPCFKTNKLLKVMSKSPNKNMLLGYDQEDAQEFFQTILSEIERNAKSVDAKEPERQPIAEEDLPEGAVIGQAHLNVVGDVFLPAEQIDPNLLLTKGGKKFYTPYRLVTPFDGITAERIGCLQCGENGGIRYSVSSGLSLNLPNEDIGSTVKLSDLMNEWIKPEIIEGVECNRCALEAVREHLLEQLKQYESKGDSIPEKLLKAFQARVEELDRSLAQPVVSDEDYKRLHTENMVRKCSKSKQILFLRPSPLLSIHINRSVFDPRTYMIRKNNAKVLFKSRLNLSPWCCDIDEINLDARLPMSKKGDIAADSSDEENVGNEYYTRLHQTYEREFEDEDEDEDEDEEEEEEEGDSRYVNRDVSNYDPLNGEADSASSFSNIDHEDRSDEEYLEETDALGNTITKRIPKDRIDGGLDESKEAIHIDGEQDGANHISSESDDEEEEQTAPPPPAMAAPIRSTVPSGPLTYVLRSVIVHYGTHNYGHYIAFRKYRNIWWRISDETVYTVDEAEVLSTPGVFMLFYEYDYDESSGEMKEDMADEEDIDEKSLGQVEDNCASDVSPESDAGKDNDGETAE
ncbi:hypothetical protein HG536_0A02350 [Torulaspora globosa]|uniref:Ubiquitin carboxyl-terminal hydrolase n=1 Tax=Torulaspora globosa TaxID=48254 RepID=A0A7G3ZA82_9SACH|nr:uncharacterized protein HG536_0A02350 [Torulaspora globosa]QLL30418.1 hypothetical protein HG536_0A02350 [Torulaspora globosa]